MRKMRPVPLPWVERCSGANARRGTVRTMSDEAELSRRTRRADLPEAGRKLIDEVARMLLQVAAAFRLEGMAPIMAEQATAQAIAQALEVVKEASHSSRGRSPRPSRAACRRRQWADQATHWKSTRRSVHQLANALLRRSVRMLAKATEPGVDQLIP